MNPWPKENRPQCPKHPAYRGIDAPALQKYCPGCENVWVWALEMRRQKAERKAQGVKPGVRVVTSLSQFKRLTAMGNETMMIEDVPELLLGTAVKEE